MNAIDWGSDAVRQWSAALVAGAWLLMCVSIAVNRRRANRAAPRPMGGGAQPVLVAYASQTGFGDQLARATFDAIQTAGVPARLVPLSQVTADDLAATERALFIASTCGEGDAPDNASLFVRRVLGTRTPLTHLHYGVLALGDRQYRDYCGFGRRLDGWLASVGASPLFERIDVDNANEAAVADWRHRLSHVVGTTDLPDWQAPPWEPWRLVARTHLNPGSAGGPVHRLQLEPPGPSVDWASGDLLQVRAPADPDRPREYSIASIPAEGRLHLLVRQERHPDGSLGVASGWLTEGLAVGDAVDVRLRPHENFRLGDNARRPLLLIGNGTGLAGLRGHLQARAAQGGPACWLVFGERQAAHDALCGDEIAAWLQRGVLARADLVFSRDGDGVGTPREYVQDRLRASADEVRRWVAEGAAVYVCGSLQGMAGGVDAALGEVLGVEALQALAAEGRYRRDVY